MKSVGLLVGSQIAWIVRGPFGGRDAGPRRAVIDRHGVVRAQRGRVRLDHRVQLEPLADLGQDRHAELAAAVRDHEVDRLGRDLLGRADEVALVLAVLGIDDDHHPAVADRLDGIFNRGKTAGHADLFQLSNSCQLGQIACAAAELFGRVADSYYRGSGERSTNGHELRGAGGQTRDGQSHATEIGVL